MDKKPLYLTTTLPYVNAEPHIGFALEIVHADIIARFNRLMGREVFFNTGTDEHGQKIAQAAEKEGMDVEAYADKYAEKFRTLKGTLGLSNELHFIRTTDPEHIKAAQHIWNLCLNNEGPDGSDIYKKKYKGLYCVGDEMFLRESDLVNGRCPNHPNIDPIEVEEENYFFRLTRYKEDLKKYLSNSEAVLPDWRRGEALAFVDGLQDISISREKARLSWGVPVPNDDAQVMYVWFDALTNYISTLGWPEDKQGEFEKFWNNGEVVQVAGKDQIRFQSVIWQAMLMSAGIKNTDRVLYHGFITSGGQKMSKSLGNVISPNELVERYGADATRYLLLAHVHPFEDSDMTWEKLDEWYGADLANGLGNMASRVLTLAQTHLTEGARPEAAGFPNEYTETMEKFEIHKAVEFIWSRVARLDQAITEKAPFKLVKSDPDAAKKIIFEFTQELYLIARMLNPIMPETNRILKEAVIANKKPENLFPRKD